MHRILSKTSVVSQPGSRLVLQKKTPELLRSVHNVRRRFKPEYGFSFALPVVLFFKKKV